MPIRSTDGKNPVGRSWEDFLRNETKWVDTVNGVDVYQTSNEFYFVWPGEVVEVRYGYNANILKQAIAEGVAMHPDMRPVLELYPESYQESFPDTVPDNHHTGVMPCSRRFITPCPNGPTSSATA